MSAMVRIFSREKRLNVRSFIKLQPICRGHVHEVWNLPTFEQTHPWKRGHKEERNYVPWNAVA